MSEDHKWIMAASRLAEQTRSKGLRMNNLDFSKAVADMMPRERFGLQEGNKFDSLNFSMLSLDTKEPENCSKSSFRTNVYNMNAVYPKSNINVVENLTVNKPSINNNSTKEPINYNNNNNENANDIRFKTLPAEETLPRNELLGGYIFVCNNDTMQNLKWLLFGLPPKDRDSVRAITPGLPLFCTTIQLTSFMASLRHPVLGAQT